MFKMFDGNRLSESNIQLSGPISCFLSAWSSSHVLVISGHRATWLLLADMQEPLGLCGQSSLNTCLHLVSQFVHFRTLFTSHPLMTYPRSLHCIIPRLNYTSRSRVHSLRTVHGNTTDSHFDFFHFWETCKSFRNPFYGNIAKNCDCSRLTDLSTSPPPPATVC